MHAATRPNTEWKVIRLELAGTPEFPNGSPSRAFILRLPLDANGKIDEYEVEAHPAMASVRRFWPSEPDQQGNARWTNEGWTFVCRYGENLEECLLRLAPQLLRPGELVTLTTADGNSLPFTVASVAP